MKRKVRLLQIVLITILLSSCAKNTSVDEEKTSDYFPDILGQKKYKHSWLFVSNHNTRFYTSGIVTWNFQSRFVRNDTTITVINYSIADTMYSINKYTQENGSFEIYEDKNHFLMFSKLPPINVSKWIKYPRYIINGAPTVQYDSVIFKKNTGLIHIGVSEAYGGYNILDLIE